MRAWSAPRVARGWRTTHFWKTWLQCISNLMANVYVYIAETAELQKPCTPSALASQCIACSCAFGWSGFAQCLLCLPALWQYFGQPAPARLGPGNIRFVWSYSTEECMQGWAQLHVKHLIPSTGGQGWHTQCCDTSGHDWGPEHFQHHGNALIMHIHNSVMSNATPAHMVLLYFQPQLAKPQVIWL